MSDSDSVIVNSILSKEEEQDILARCLMATKSEIKKRGTLIQRFGFRVQDAMPIFQGATKDQTDRAEKTGFWDRDWIVSWNLDINKQTNVVTPTLLTNEHLVTTSFQPPRKKGRPNPPYSQMDLVIEAGRNACPWQDGAYKFVLNHCARCLGTMYPSPRQKGNYCPSCLNNFEIDTVKQTHRYLKDNRCNHEFDKTLYLSMYQSLRIGIRDDVEPGLQSGYVPSEILHHIMSFIFDVCDLCQNRTILRSGPPCRLQTFKRILKNHPEAEKCFFTGEHEPKLGKCELFPCSDCKIMTCGHCSVATTKHWNVNTRLELPSLITPTIIYIRCFWCAFPDV